MKKRNQFGFTLIELLVVISIIGLLSTLAVISLNGAREKARDAQRLSDVKQLSTVLEIENAQNDPGTAIATCVADGAPTDTCDNPGDVGQFSNFEDPTTNGTVCHTTAAVGCDYSVSLCNEAAGACQGGAAATLDDYQICFYMEAANNVGGGAAGIKSIVTGGVLRDGCI